MDNLVITRKELYNGVWTEPMTLLAKKMEISESNLRRLCKEHGIPLPAVGYWKKLEFGKPVEKIELPVLPDIEKTIIVCGEDSVNSMEKEIEIALAAMPKKVSDPKGEIDMNVTNKTKVRAINFIQQLLKALQYRGHSVIVKNGCSYAVVKNIHIKLYIKEKEKRITNPESKHSIDKYKLVFTGILYLKYGENYKAKQIEDGKLPLEQQVPKIIAALEAEAESEIIEMARRKEWHDAYERKLEDDRRLLQKEQEVKKREKKLLKQAKKFQHANLIREYIKAIELQPYSEKGPEWLAWAKQQADLLDPTL